MEENSNQTIGVGNKKDKVLRDFPRRGSFLLRSGLQTLRKLTRKQILCGIGFYFLFLFVFGDRGLLNLYLLKRELKTFQAKVVELNTEKSLWQIRILSSHLSNDLMELTAREKLNLSYAGEYVYLFTP